MATRPQHPEKLKQEDLYAFVTAWNANPSKFHVAEKLDGFHFVYGRDEVGYYTRTLTKSRKYYEADDYPDVFYMKDFRRFHTAFADCTFPDELGTFEITGEMIPNECPNVILYNRDIVDNGIFQILSVRFDDQIPYSLLNYPPDFYAAIHLSRNACDIMILPIETANPFENVRFSEQLVKHLEPASPLESKTVDFAYVGDEIRRVFMSSSAWSSTFGNEVEGFVITGTLKTPIKIVDKELFLKRKDENWRYMDRILTIERNACKLITSDPTTACERLILWSNELAEVKHELDNDLTLVPLPCKRFDTFEQIKLSYIRQDAILQLVSTLSPDEFATFTQNNRLDRLT